MNEGQSPDAVSFATAEKVLHRLYGDDLHGCPATLDEIARLVHESFTDRGVPELLELYEKLIDAIHLLSTPPDRAKVAGQEQLTSLLSERLDAIHTLTEKTLETTAVFKRGGGGLAE